MRNIKSKKPKKPLIIKDKKGKIVGSEDGQVNLITEFFKELFFSDEIAPVINRAEMDPPFDKEEVAKAATKLKNKKSCGKDGIYAKLLKYSPEEAHKQIANMLNSMARTGEYPIEIKSGILTPLAKLPQKDVNINVRLIVLLSVIGKTHYNLDDRTWNRMKGAIPKSKAAYLEGRSTTDQVFRLKKVIEKTISTGNYNIWIILLDM